MATYRITVDVETDKEPTTDLVEEALLESDYFDMVRVDNIKPLPEVAE